MLLQSHSHKEYRITGMEPDEVMVEDWLALSNEAVHAILLESARPTSYARIIFPRIGYLSWKRDFSKPRH